MAWVGSSCAKGEAVMLMPLLIAAAFTVGQQGSNSQAPAPTAVQPTAAPAPRATLSFSDAATAPPQDTGSAGTEATATPPAAAAETPTQGGAYSSSAEGRRALPAPFNSPPFPSGEYQGYPLVGV